MELFMITLNIQYRAIKFSCLNYFKTFATPELLLGVAAVFVTHSRSNPGTTVETTHATASETTIENGTKFIGLILQFSGNQSLSFTCRRFS